MVVVKYLILSSKFIKNCLSACNCWGSLQRPQTPGCIMGERRRKGGAKAGGEGNGKGENKRRRDGRKGIPPE